MPRRFRPGQSNRSVMRAGANAYDGFYRSFTYAPPAKDPKGCSICGETAIYKVKRTGFCRRHKAEATQAQLTYGR